MGIKYVSEPGAGMNTGNEGKEESNRTPESESRRRVTPAGGGWAQVLGRALSSASAPDARGAVLRELVIEVGDLCSVDAASLYLYNAKRDLKCETSFGLSNRASRRIEEMVQLGAASQLSNAQNVPFLLEDIRVSTDDGADSDAFLGMLAGEGVIALASFPLIAHDKLLGFMTLYHRSRRVYEKEDVDNLSLLTGVLAMALLNNQLAEARTVEDKGRDHFISALSHELRTPLTSIIGFTQVIRRKLANAPGSDARMAEHMDIIWTQAQRLNRLIDTFVDIANIEQGDFSIKFSKVELLSVLKSAIEETVARLDPTSEIELAVPDHPVWVRGDRQRLEQVFSHVISNALRYSPEKSPVGITCMIRAAHNEVEVSVTDKGPGISDHMRDAIFERFYQAEALRSGGLGVGLYLSKTIVEAHGGRVLVESKPGEGTTMSIILPM